MTLRAPNTDIVRSITSQQPTRILITSQRYTIMVSTRKDPTTRSTNTVNNLPLSYMFLRFVKMMFNIFVVYTLFTFVVIIPIHIVGLPIDNGREIERISWTKYGYIAYCTQCFREMLIHSP